MSTRPTSSRSVLIVLALAATTSLSFLGSRPLVGTSEGRYAACAQEMLTSGDFVHPTLNGAPHWTKPPLTYWAIAAGVRVLGSNGWGVRILNASAFIVTALLVCLLGRRLGTPAHGLLAGLVYATAPVTVIASWVTTTDTILTLWMTLAVYCWVSAAQARCTSRSTVWLTAGGAALGLAFMTKGPPALLALVPMAAWRVRPARRALPGLVLGLAAFAVIGLGWFAWVCYEDHALLSYFMGEEVVNRVRAQSGATPSRIQVHNDEWYKSLTVYAPALAAGLGPWMVPVYRAIWQRRRRLRAALRADPRLRLLLVWVALPLGVFALSASKLALYVLPLFAPLSLGAAWLLAAHRPADGCPQVWSAWRRWALCCAALLIVGKGVASYLPMDHDMRRIYRTCRALVPQGRVALYNESRHYGLQFYLQGGLERVSDRPREPWADMTLRRWLNQVGSSARPAVIVARSTQDAARVVQTIASDHPTLRIGDTRVLRDRTVVMALAAHGGTGHGAD